MSDKANFSEDELLRIVKIAREAAGVPELDTQQGEAQDPQEKDPSEKAIRKGAGLE